MNNKELVKSGHELAKAISSDTPLIEIVKMVSNLATQLDVQIARSHQLSIALEAAEKRIAELEALEAKTVWSDIDMSDADCFTITRLHEIIYASELKWPEPKLLARFMLDVKQRNGAAQ